LATLHEEFHEGAVTKEKREGEALMDHRRKKSLRIGGGRDYVV
jgi:hypothetical protein